jgi:eukaryotic-like serine/threonine-protein kinase
VLKITDFGFSILAEKYIPSLTREGTLQYMSLEKLTDQGFVADEKADVYSLGVMMHELLTKMHPYVNQRNLKSYKEYVLALKNAQLFRPRLVTTFSAPLLGLYDLVTRMVAKSPLSRVNCQEIYDYLDNDEAFTPFRLREKEKTEEVLLNLPPMTITEKTSVFAIPFAVAPEEEQGYVDRIKCEQ